MTNSTNTQIKLAFVWQGISGRYGQWQDGLFLAMQILEKEYEVTYHEPQDEIPEDAIVLYWEAPVTILGRDSEHYKRIQNLPNKKALLFAGGRIEHDWLNGFDHVFVESKINGEELDDLCIPHSTAFGINEQIFKPEKQPKIFDVAVFGTCASWKRQGIIGRAIGNKMVVAGRDQETDPMPFRECRENGCLVFNELHPTHLNTLVNASHCIVNGAEYWGGGQRVTLEAMSAGIPVICMSDSPKNREYVEESGAGLVCEPTIEGIRNAVEEIKQWTDEEKQRGIKYIQEKWTGEHYANNLRNWIKTQHV